MARRTRRPPTEEEGHSGAAGMERWLLTYSDMITLLLALFVILFALSTINLQKFRAFRLGIDQVFNPTASVLHGSSGLEQNMSLEAAPGTEEVVRSPLRLTSPLSTLHAVTPANAAAAAAAGPTAEQSPAAAAAELTTVERRIEAALAAKGLSGAASERIERRGLVVQVLADKVFYAVDSADLGPYGDEVVDTIASVLRGEPNDIVVEGYTDNEPIYGGPYTTNYALSAMRAVNVVVRLNRVDGIPRDRLAAIGYGQTRPAVPNTSPANQALNRRIDVVVLAPGQTRE
jgi:chemotaxis protein MotB